MFKNGWREMSFECLPEYDESAPEFSESIIVIPGIAWGDEGWQQSLSRGNPSQEGVVMDGESRLLKKVVLQIQRKDQVHFL